MMNNMQVEPSQEVEEVSQAKASGALSRIGRILFRLLVAVLIGLALGVGLYYGAIRLYRETIEPIQNYEERISELERSIEAMTSSFESESQEQTERQAAIEGRLAEQAEALASVEALLNATQEDLREQRRILATVPELGAEVENLNRALGDLSILTAELEAAIASGDLPAQRVQRTAVYLRVMSMLTRAKMELDRNNLGFAEELVQAASVAMDELIEAEEAAEPYGDEDLTLLINERLATILSNLPGRPDVAADDLEAVWKLLMEVLQPVQLDEPETGGV